MAAVRLYGLERDFPSILRRPARLIRGKSFHLSSVPPDAGWVSRLKQRVKAIAQSLLTTHINPTEGGIRSNREILAGPNPQTNHVGKSQTVKARVPHDANTAELLFRGISLGIDVFGNHRTKIGVQTACQPSERLPAIPGVRQGQSDLRILSRPARSSPIATPVRRVEGQRWKKSAVELLGIRKAFHHRGDARLVVLVIKK